MYVSFCLSVCPFALAKLKRRKIYSTAPTTLELRRLHLDLIFCYKVIFCLLLCQSISMNFFTLITVSTTRGHKYKLYKPQFSCSVRQMFLLSESQTFEIHYHRLSISHPWQHSSVALVKWISPPFFDTVNYLIVSSSQVVLSKNVP